MLNGLLRELNNHSMSINWPDLVFPPINLYSAPYYTRKRNESRRFERSLGEQPESPSCLGREQQETPDEVQTLHEA